LRHHPYLWNRKGNYYFRIAVPLSLVPILGRKDLAYSLKTKDPIEAKLRSWEALNKAQEAFRQVRHGQAVSLALGYKSPASIPAAIFPAERDTDDAGDMLSAIYERYLLGHRIS